ncbi:hypothetical protein F5Y04DRAFT_242642 [Hypomontagnella monticulosa]|nr:hypothetical protein F5Y04DRAFT_242642 [Hypomontagnella monticulosa]
MLSSQRDTRHLRLKNRVLSDRTKRPKRYCSISTFYRFLFDVLNSAWMFVADAVQKCLINFQQGPAMMKYLKCVGVATAVCFTAGVMSCGLPGCIWG